jgi:hypothetical protein
MPLPKIDLPIHELKLISVKDPVKYRPFLVKEEKLLLMGLESNDEDNILSTIKQVINNCLITELNVDELPIFDIEYLFLNMRARSVGEVVDSFFICKNVTNSVQKEDGTIESVVCGHAMKVPVSLLDIKPPINDLPTRIPLSKTIGIELRYPNIDTFQSIRGLVEVFDNAELFELIYKCTKMIYDKNSVVTVDEFTKEELFEFLESLTQDQFDKIVTFFEKLPTIQYNAKATCEKCKFTHNLKMEGLRDFFL